MTTIPATLTSSVHITAGTTLTKRVTTCKASSSRGSQISLSPSYCGTQGALKSQGSRIRRLNATDQDKDGVSSSSSNVKGSDSRRAERSKPSQEKPTQKSQSLLSQVFGNQLPIMAFVSALTFAAYKGMVSGQDGPEKVLMAPSVMAVVLMVSFFGWRMMAELRRR